MKKVKYILFMLISLMMPSVALATDYVVCGNDYKFPLVVANLFSILMTVIRLVIPILLVISGMISFLKVTFSSNVDEDMKKAKGKLINSIIAAVIIFFIVSIVNFVIAFVIGKNNDAQSCIKCFIKPDSCVHEDSLGTRLCPGFMDDLDKYDENCNLIDDGSSDNSDNSNNNQDPVQGKFVLIDGDGTNVGDEVAINTEHFYVVSSNESETVLLAKYNLYVGGVYGIQGNHINDISKDDPGYLLQNEKARGYISDTSIRVGTLAFSDTAYWLDSNNKFLDKYEKAVNPILNFVYDLPTTYKVYDSNSNLYSYVEQYRKIIESYGISVIKAEILDVKYVLSVNHSDHSELAESTNFWFDCSYVQDNSIRVCATLNDYGFNEKTYAGVRPVIVVNTSDIKK